MASSCNHMLHARHSIWEAKHCDFTHETIASAIIKAAKSVRPESPAVRGPTGTEICYRDLVKKAFNISKLLGQRPVDSYVGILVPRDVQHPICVLGVLLSGAAFLPMSSTLPEDRMRYIVEDSACNTIITTNDYSTQLDWFTGNTILYDDIPTDEVNDKVVDDMISRVGISNLAYAIYTSGTTGKPKGVEVEQLGVLNMLAHHKAESVKQDQIKQCVIVASFIFDSSIREMFLPLTSGTCLCIAENVLNMTEGTCCGGTPSGMAVAQIPTSMKVALIGGERLTVACVKHLKALQHIVNVYGPTETTVECTTHMTDPAKENEIALIGRPIRNVSAYGVHTDSKQLVDKGQQGELWISGPGVARGYRNRPDLNKDKFIPNPWKEGERIFRTGDLVKWAPAGDIEFLGRADSQVKLRGYRIELEEIERVCSEVPGVKKACVIMAKDLRNTDQIVAYVEPPVEESEVTEFCGAKMPQYMVPARVICVEKLALTMSGKIDKRQLPEVVWAAPEVLPDLVEPATPMERALCNLIENVFEVKVSTDADFFNELGMTSLDCAALVAEARAIDIPIAGTGACLAHPTVQKLANHLLKDQGEAEVQKRIQRRLAYEAQDHVAAPMERTLCNLIENVFNMKCSADSDFFKDLAMTSLDCAALVTEARAIDIPIAGTAVILANTTVQKLAHTLLKNNHAANVAAPVERALCNLIENVFKMKCSADSDFFKDLAMTSLDCAALVTEARAVGIPIAGTAVILANTTVQKLAKHLMQNQKNDHAAASMEHALCKLIENVFKMKCSPDSDFFKDLAMTSLDCAALVTEARAINIQIAGTAVILANTTVQKLASHLLKDNHAAAFMERALCNLIENVFKMKCSADTDFFKDLAMTSLDCAALVTEARAIDIQIAGTAVILANPTVQKLTKHLLKDLEGAEQKRTQQHVAYEAHAHVLEEPLSRRMQWVAFGFGFIWQTLICFWPPAALATLILCETHRIGRTDPDWQARLALGNFDPGFMATFWTIPILFAVMTPLVLLWGVLLKWLIIGRYKPGLYVVGGKRYILWWLAHGCLTFNNMFILPVFRNTFVINWYYRLLGMKIGKGTLVDTTAILEPDLISVGNNCRLQSDCLLNAHVIRWVVATQSQILCLGRIQIDDNVVVGPSSTVVVKDASSVTRVRGSMPALTSAQMLPDDYADFADQILWQPAIGVGIQTFGMLLSLLLHWISVMVPVVVFYQLFLNGITTEQNGYQLGHAYFVLWWVHFYWLGGLPYILLVGVFKWTVIFKFKEGPSSRGIDNKRFLLQMLVQSRLLQNTVFLGASSHIITLYFRFMGARIGWNVQVMPCNLIEFDLLSIGDCVAFGGFISWFPRDKDGNMQRIEVGNFSAVTNSAVVMSGTKVGDNCVVGNLTLCRTNCVVPDNTKAIGNPMIQFGNESDPVEMNRTRSNLTMFAHLVASYFVELVDVPAFLLNIFVVDQFMGPVRDLINDKAKTQEWPFPLQSLGHAVESIVFVPAFAVGIVITVIIFRRFFCARFSGAHERDSFIFVQFMYFTKVMVSTDVHIFRMLNGTPFMPLIYNAMGGKMALTSLLFFRHCADFDELTINEKAIVDFDSYLETHQKTATELVYEPVEIGVSAAVGQRSILLRGSLLSAQSTVVSNSTVLPGEEVPVGSIIAENPGRVINNEERQGTKGDIVKASTKAGRNSIVGLRAANRVAEEIAREKPGMPPAAAGRASLRVAGGRASLRVGGGRASLRVGGGRASLRVGGGRASLRVKPRSSVRSSGSAQEEKMEIGAKDVVDHVVVGAGICGLVMAQELIQQGKSYMCLEKTKEILGCWTGAVAANKTSHVAVSEPAFRFDYDHKGKYPSDFTIRDEFLADGRRYVAAHDISITFNATVTQVEQKGKGWSVTYVKDNKLCTVESKGVFMALGAQQTPRTLTYPGEDIFEGTISKGIRDDMPLDMFEGATVVIVGGGAFGCENLRTALMHGAEHVHICYRKAMQCWPRVSHYGGTLGGKVGDLAQPYVTACKWAGLEGKVEPFMSRRSTAQPTASDVFFMAYKAGRLSLHNTVITQVKSRSVSLKNGTELPCDVLMKCLGWMDPPLKKVMPEFSSRKWVFLNNQASCAFVCDPHYQHKQGSNRTLNSLGDLQVKGGTFSVLTLAHIAAKLQLYFMENPEDFAKTMAQLPESPEVVCNWFQQKWEYEGLPSVNKIIDETLNTAKDRTRQKFPTIPDYLAMAEKKCKSDCSRFLSRWPGYIFNMDGSGNFYDMPEDLKSNPAKTKQLQKKEETVQIPSIQQNAYNPVRAQV